MVIDAELPLNTIISLKREYLRDFTLSPKKHLCQCNHIEDNILKFNVKIIVSHHEKKQCMAVNINQKIKLLTCVNLLFYLTRTIGDL